jgi:3'-phosphoadenosine 5'-phosphosulfate sulfotransferase (PAPS reductase)/FAD synthetase
MRITMVKKRLASGEPCPKCMQTEDMLRRRGYWDRIDEVVWAIEGEPSAPGWAIALRHDIQVAPFFVVEQDGEETALTSPLRLIKQHLDDSKRPPATAPGGDPAAGVRAWAVELSEASPQEVIAFGLERWGEACAIAFSGGLDVVLLDMATRLGSPFRVFTVDTGRLNEETYAYLDAVRARYGIELEVFLPDAGEVMQLMTRHGANSFLREGHAGCCAVRQVRPLARALEGRPAWLTGRLAVDEGGGASAAAVEIDPPHDGSTPPIVRLNPLARWSREDVLAYAKANDVPLNPLLAHGHRVIGCAPCTRALGPDDPPRRIRWWWEEGAAPEPDVHLGGEGI